MNVRVKIHVSNAPASVAGKFIVARLVDGDLWYWGAWHEKSKAQEIANALDNAIVLEGLS